MITRNTQIILFLLILLAFSTPAVSQQFGLPGFQNFPRSEYKGGTQNWAVARSENGMMYFANNDGLVEYDGAHWSIYRDMELIYRAICIDGKRIYVGAYNNFGYYEPNENGILVFHSLIPLLKGRINDFDEIWRIHKTVYGIVFQSFRAIFILNQNKIDIVYPRSKFHFSYYVNGVVWVYDEVQGLMQLREGKVRQIPDGSFFSGTEIWTILPLNDDQVIVGTAKNGVYKYDGVKVVPWDKPVNELLKKYQIFSGALIRPGYFAFGTIQNGLILTDTSGQARFELNKERGLLNNTVLSIGTDQQGGLWLGLDNGISLVHLNSPLTYIQNYFDIGSGYASASYNGKLYLGTNQGLFYISWSDFINPFKKKEDFHLIEGTEGQVWDLAIIDNTLLCGHNSGLFQIIDNKAVKISSIPGAWNIIKSRNKKSLLLVGHYSGISVLERNGPLWVYRNEISGFDQSSHYFAEDKRGDIWISHGYKGIFRIRPDSSFTRVIKRWFYGTSKGLPTLIGNNLFQIQSGIVVTTRNGIYRFNENTDKFEPDMQFRQLLPGFLQIDYVKQDSNNNIWYYNDKQPGVLRLQEDGSLKNITAPFVELKGQVIPSYGHINALDNANVIIGIEGGFAHYLTGLYKDFNYIPNLYISKLHSSSADEGTYRFNSVDKAQKIIPEFKYSSNTISIVFAASQFNNLGIKYKFRLKGFDKDWSDWTNQNTKEYTNLPYGDYIFQLKAQTVSGKITPELDYKFRILPPWYASKAAWVIYFLVFCGIVFLLYRFFLISMEKSRLKEKQAQKDKFFQKEQKLKEEALITEKEMIRLRNEKLNLEMIHKEKELANSTLMIIQKNEFLLKLRNDLNRIKNNVTEEPVRNEINSSLKRIGKEIDNEKQWQLFNLHVEQVHEPLFKKLKEQYPSLSPRELSLCAYLRMNISSKEIATLMNISTRGVEISRYRIRKKMGLDRNSNLTDFMMNI